LTTDDGIHHGAGMAYEKVLLRKADKKTKQALVDAANRLLPIFAEHALWRPKERAFIGNTMRSRDIETGGRRSGPSSATRCARATSRS